MEKPTVLLCPSLGLGHVRPFLELSKKLLHRGFTVYFVGTVHIMDIITSHAAEAAKDGMEVVPLMLDLDMEAANHAFHSYQANNSNSTDPNSDATPPLGLLAQLMEQPFERLLRSLVEGNREIIDKKGILRLRRPLCILTDGILGWSFPIAEKLGIPRVYVETSGCYARNMAEVAWNVVPCNFQRTDSGRYVFPDQVNFTAVAPPDMPPELLGDRLPAGPRELLVNNWNLDRKSWMTVVNTCYELENIHVDQFQKRMSGPVRAVGPLLPASFFDAKSRDHDSDEMRWLDSRPPNSVVYIAFGSENSLSTAQIKEMAKGLEASGVGFIWVLRFPSDQTQQQDDDAASLLRFLPEGFYDRIKKSDQGFVVCGWVQQHGILSHPAIGAFISHCGWNSVLEAVASGVPIIPWPQFAEQPFNAKLVVAEAKIGLKLNFQEEFGKVKGEEIASVLSQMIHGEEGMKVRKKVGEMKEATLKAIAPGGSSSNSFDMLVQDILSLREERKVVC